MREKLTRIIIKHFYSELDDTEAIDAILSVIRESVTEEMKKWKDHKDKFGIGVHAGMEAIEYMLKEDK